MIQDVPCDPHNSVSDEPGGTMFVCDMNCVLTGTPSDVGARPVEVFGVPYHVTTYSLIEAYRQSTLDAFLVNESRHSCGNYVIIDRATKDHEVTRVITSVGYAGGYITETENHVHVSTILSPILEKLTEVTIDPQSLLRYYRKSATQMDPFSTPFIGVRRLPPAFVYEIRRGRFSRAYSFLCVGRSEDEPGDFASALEETMSAIASHEDEAILMLSGGIDSTALGVAFDEVRPQEKILRAVSVQRANKINNPERAKAVCERLGWDLDVVQAGYPEVGLGPNAPSTVVECIEKEMTDDFVIPGNPHRALEGRAEIILHGQNMDAVATCGMKTGQPLRSHERLYSAVRRLRRNLQRTHLAQWYPTYERWLLGMVSTGKPNVIHRGDRAQVESIVDELRAVVPATLRDDHLLVDALYFYQYSHSCGKLLSTFPTSGGGSVVMPAMSGPLLTLFLGRRRGIREAVTPKREIYAYVEEKIGGSYYKMFKNMRASPSSGERRKAYSPLVKKNRFRLQSRDSVVLKLVEGLSGAKEVEELYETLNRRIAPDGQIDARLRPLAERVLNVELLVSHRV